MVRYQGPIILELHDEVLFARGHLIHRWATGIAREMTINSKKEAPVNKRTASGGR